MLAWSNGGKSVVVIIKGPNKSVILPKDFKNYEKIVNLTKIADFTAFLKDHLINYKKFENFWENREF